MLKEFQKDHNLISNNQDDDYHVSKIDQSMRLPLTQKVPINDETLVAGTALEAVKNKWEELGPLNLEDIIANSSIDVDNSLPFNKSKYDQFIVG